MSEERSGVVTTFRMMQDRGPRSWRERLFSWPWRPWVSRSTLVYEFRGGTVRWEPPEREEISWALPLYDSAHAEPKYYELTLLDELGNRHPPTPGEDVGHEDAP